MCFSNIASALSVANGILSKLSLSFPGVWIKGMVEPRTVAAAQKPQEDTKKYDRLRTRKIYALPPQ